MCDFSHSLLLSLTKQKEAGYMTKDQLGARVSQCAAFGELLHASADLRSEGLVSVKQVHPGKGEQWLLSSQS